MNKMVLAVVLILGVMVSNLSAEGLQWPLKNKDVSDISIFFDHDDAVDVIKRCSNKRFPKHLGIDIRTYVGADVYPAYPGKVEYTTNSMNNGWGKFIVLSHSNNNWTTVYWHLSSVNVKVGDIVDKNDIIGSVHDTSHVGDVPHLHFGIRNGKYINESKKGIGGCDNDLSSFLDPLDYLPSKDFILIDDEQVPHRGTWKKSTIVDFYTNKGYKATNTKKSYALYPYKLPSNGKYNMYERSTKASDRRSDAAYILYVNNKYVKHTFVDQTEIDDKGKSRFLFSYDGKKDDVLVVIPYNHKDDGDWLVSDSVLFKKQ